MAERHQARRDDDVDRWLKRWRDTFTSSLGGLGIHQAVWQVVDRMLDDYREHADTGTPLDAEVAEHEQP